MNRVRDLGAALIRTHYPLQPAFQDLADRRGVLVWSEVPVYGVREAALAHASVRAHALDMLRADVGVNGNHPSVLGWSVGDRCRPPPVPASAPTSAPAVALLHRLDRTRPAALAFAGYPARAATRGPTRGSDCSRQRLLRLVHARRSDRRPRGPPVLSRRRAPVLPLPRADGHRVRRRGEPDRSRGGEGRLAFQSELRPLPPRRVPRGPWLAGATWWTLQESRVSPDSSGGSPAPRPRCTRRAS